MTLAAGARPTDIEVATLRALVPVMDAAERRTSAMERQVVDLAEAWTVRDRVGEVLHAVVVDVRGRDVEVQVDQPPLRASLTVGDGVVPALGAPLDVRLVAVDVEGGQVRLEAVG